jgi:hypothetical protein
MRSPSHPWGFTKLGRGHRGEEYGSRTMSAPDGPVSLGLIRSHTG